MINNVESNITWAITEMEKENCVQISGYITMGNNEVYRYEIRKLKNKQTSNSKSKEETK